MLSCIGMMETVRIRRSGYPVRRSFEDFLFRYNVLGRHLSPSMADKQKCEAILAPHVTNTQSRDWQPGKTKVMQQLKNSIAHSLILNQRYA